MSTFTVVMMLGRIGKRVIVGENELQSTREDLEKAINEFNSALSHFGHNVVFKTFDRIQGHFLLHRHIV